MDNEDVVHRYTHTHTHREAMEYYSAIKKNEIMPFAATRMDLKIIMLSEVSQKEKDKYHKSLAYGIKNTTQMNLSTKQKQAQKYREQNHCQEEGRGLEGKDWEVRTSRCKQLYIGWKNNKVLLQGQRTTFNIL